jgi:uncharacterized protein RhaS with RHS repeats
MLGLYQMGARYYQPGTGRFTQADPLPSSVFEANRYAYVGANPCNRTDPTGLFPIEPGCAISVGSTVGGAVADYGPHTLIKAAGWGVGVGLGIWGTVRDLQDFDSWDDFRHFDREDSWEYVDVGADVVSTGFTALPVLDAPYGTIISAGTTAYSCVRAYR